MVKMFLSEYILNASLETFVSARCDCGNQLALSMTRSEAAGRGHECRGIGLGHKLHAYNLQDAGRDTIEANEDLGLPIDSENMGIDFKRSWCTATNNPAMCSRLRGYGLAISARVPLVTSITKENKRYLDTKRAKMGHIYGLEVNGLITGIFGNNGSESITLSSCKLFLHLFDKGLKDSHTFIADGQ
ncbi:hypothetical protein Leryth_026689 [Lithospermum erythrorhizon]|nr:hypothetical protein Leryth_026689 [Lithospermum erythrorhizon]